MLLPDPAPDGEIYLTTAQAAEAMSVTPPARRRWVRIGYLAGVGPGFYAFSAVAAAQKAARDAAARPVAALRELAGGRADLLAEVAGLLEGAHEGKLDEPLTRQAAMLCRKAGADPEAIPAWIEEGRRRAAAARQPPFSGGLQAGGVRRP